MIPPKEIEAGACALFFLPLAPSVPNPRYIRCRFPYYKGVPSKISGKPPFPSLTWTNAPFPDIHSISPNSTPRGP